MSVFTVTYYVNADRDKFWGYKSGHAVTEAFPLIVNAETTRGAAETAFGLCQRIDGTRASESLLDHHECPSMSVGDVVLVQEGTGPVSFEIEWLAVASLGVEGIDPPREIKRHGSVWDTIDAYRARQQA